MTDLLGLGWSHIYDLVDPTLIDSAITDNITSILDLHVPVRTFRTGSQKNKLITNISNFSDNHLSTKYDLYHFMSLGTMML